MPNSMKITNMPMSNNLKLSAASQIFNCRKKQQVASQFLAQFHTPLIERVDAEDHPFDKDAVLIKRDDLAERERIKCFISQRG